MLKIEFIKTGLFILSILCSVALYSQSVFSGKITPHPQWENYIYIKVFESFSKNPILIDSISIREDGSFEKKIEFQQELNLVQLSMVPIEMNRMYITDNMNQNFITIAINKNENYNLTSTADSFFLHFKSETNPLSQYVQDIQTLKKPYFDLINDVTTKINKKPDSAFHYKEMISKKMITIYTSIQTRISALYLSI